MGSRYVKARATSLQVGVLWKEVDSQKREKEWCDVTWMGVRGIEGV